MTLMPMTQSLKPSCALAPAARFKLATLVQYVPLPVVGGYLGYVGYFCLAAGIGLGTNTTIDTFTSWTALASQGGSMQADSECLDALRAQAALVTAR